MRRPLLLVSFCLVTLIAFVYCRWPVSDEAGPPDGTTIRVVGRVCEKDDNSFTILSEAAVLQQSDSKQYNFIEEMFCKRNRRNKLLVSYDGSKDVILGSEVTLKGTFYAFSQATNPGEFDYARYYHSMGYLGRMRSVQILGQNGDVGLQEWLYQLRCYWERRIYAVFPQKEASVMAAILLGEKSDVDEGIQALYQRNGIVHILSISGLHITIIGMGIYKLLRRIGLPVWPAALLGAGILVLYGMMTGFGVSVCRAIGMYLLRMLGLLWRRTYDMLTALGVVGAGMVLFRPAWLGHMGFLLSFGSVLGLGLMVPAFMRRKDEDTECGKPKRYVEGKVRQVLQRVGQFVCDVLREGLLSGVSITLTTLPIQLWFSYEISIYSVFLNALILPLMSAVMVCGLIAMLVPGLGVVGTVDVFILSGYEGLCHVFEALPAAMWNPGRPLVWQVVVYYLLWALVVWVLPWIGRRLRQKRNVQTFMVGLPGKWRFKVSLFRARRLAQVLLLVLAVGILAVPRSSGDRVTFLDVGQGDCVCVQLASGEVYLFDCGSSSRKGIGEDVLIPFLKYYGISEIDAVFTSHGDTDHTNGLVELLNLRQENHITIRQLILPGIEQAALQEEFGELLAAIGNADEDEIPVSVIWAGEGWTVDGDDTFLCLHPSAGRDSQGGNEGSQCFYIELHEGANKLSLLLTGDVEGIGEKELTAELERWEIGSVDVLKVAHHGSKYSTTDAFLEVAEPSVAVISCGRRNSYGHPHEETLERLKEMDSRVLATPEYGAIDINVEKEESIIRYYMWR